jgi:hypothetical protein
MAHLVCGVVGRPYLYAGGDGGIAGVLVARTLLRHDSRGACKLDAVLDKASELADQAVAGIVIIDGGDQRACQKRFRRRVARRIFASYRTVSPRSLRKPAMWSGGMWRSNTAGGGSLRSLTSTRGRSGSS